MADTVARYARVLWVQGIYPVFTTPCLLTYPSPPPSSAQLQDLNYNATTQRGSILRPSTHDNRKTELDRHPPQPAYTLTYDRTAAYS